MHDGTVAVPPLVPVRQKIGVVFRIFLFKSHISKRNRVVHAALTISR